MAWLRSIGRSIVKAVRWVGRHTRNRLGPRGRVVFDWVVGLTLIAVGVVMGFIPVLQGWIFVVAGLAVLSKHSRLARRWFEKIKKAGRGARDKFRRKD